VRVKQTHQARQQVHAEDKNHAAIYLYVARASKNVRRRMLLRLSM
jgi:hypothetical protein